MPSIHYSSGFGGGVVSYPRVAGLESNLILSRVNSGTGLDTSLLSLELKRQERRRRLARHGVNMTDPEKKTNDKTGINNRNENRREDCANDQNRYARELEQWIRKMKCTGNGGMRLEQFREIKVGVYHKPVVYGSPSLEPYPFIHKEEDYKFRGGKDKDGKWKGKGIIEFKNGDTIVGSFKDGLRHGDVKIETNRLNLRALVGTYHMGKLSGKAKLIFQDGTWMEGFFQDGILHGFARYFDEKGRLTFLGNHRNGKPFGVCWKVIKGGGLVVGRVDEKGQLSGIRIAYIFPDYRTAFVGTFNKGVMESAQVSSLKTIVEDNGIKVPIFAEPDGELYYREISNFDKISSAPLLRDPYESKMIEVRSSKVMGANDGLFAKIKIEPSTVIAFYNGRPVRPKSAEDQDYEDWNKNAYKIFDPSRKNGTIDIPEEYRDINNYCATLAHKTNHSFLPNAEFVSFDHPKYGLIPSLVAIHEIQPGEEIFVHYGYELEGCPDWYEEAWLKGSYPVPDSLKDGWGGEIEPVKTNMVGETVENCSVVPLPVEEEEK